MAVIKVPKAPRKAFNPDRPASDLLLKQIEHLEWAARPASERSPDKFRVRKPKTEGEAARVIAALTEKVLADARARREGGALPGVTDIPAPRLPRRAAKRRVARPTVKRRTPRAAAAKKRRRRKRTAR
jgi:hypothetical protein